MAGGDGMLADDFDNDGDTDFILGNLGLNSSFKASAERTVEHSVRSILYSGCYKPGVNLL